MSAESDIRELKLWIAELSEQSQSAVSALELKIAKGFEKISLRVGAIEEARNIIALAVDPAACRSRLAKIEKLSEQTAAALLKLMAERKVHNEKVERDRAELEAVREKLLNKEINLRDREGRLASDQEILERQKTTYAIATMSHLWTARRCRGSQILGRIKTPPITTLARTNEGRLNGAARHHDQRS